MAQQELRLRAVQEAVHNNLCTAGAIGKCAYRHCSDVRGTGLKGVRKGHDSERPRQAGCGDMWLSPDPFLAACLPLVDDIYRAPCRGRSLGGGLLQHRWSAINMPGCQSKDPCPWNA